MASNKSQTISSNQTGLRIAEEACIGELNSDASKVIWRPAEPNSYADFGGSIVRVARNPINESRQNQKGNVVDLEAGGGFNSDVTQKSNTELFQGFLFADYRSNGDSLRENVAVDAVAANTITISNRKAASAAVNAGGTLYEAGDTVTVTDAAANLEVTLVVDSVDGGGAAILLSVLEVGAATVDLAANAATAVLSSTAGSGLTVDLTYANIRNYAADDLLFLSNFQNETEDKRVTVVSATDTVITVAETLVVDAAPSADASVSRIGIKFASGDAVVLAPASQFPVIKFTAADLSLFDLQPGQFIYLGGDDAGSTFTNTAVVGGLNVKQNRGYARVDSVDVANKEITLDKTQSVFTAEAGVGVSLEMYFGKVVRNEKDPSLIKRRTYQLERLLGAPDPTKPTEIQSEYVTGSVPNEMKIVFATADKVTADLGFVGIDTEQRPAATMPKPGQRPAIPQEAAFNTSNNVTRAKMSVLAAGTSSPSPLFALLTDFDLTINNGVTVNKAIGILGGFDASTSNITVSGSATAYFTTVEAVTAVRNNADVSFDVTLYQDNAGIAFDLPLVGLGDAKLDVQQNEPIKLPLTLEGSESAFGHSMLVTVFDYLPSAAGLKLTS